MRPSSLVMFCCQFKRWITMARRRPIAAIAILGLVMFTSVYILHRGENYDRIGIDMLAEKETISQVVNKALKDSQPLDERQLFEMDQSERRKKIQTVCQTNTQDRHGVVNNLIGTGSNLTYCVIPRSDNTFWLQVFRYLNHDYLGSPPQSPFDLDVHQVHSRPFGRTRMHAWRMLTDEQRQMFLKSRVFMSVQDPYMRLWSTYIRALVLPELWESVGVKIAARRPRVLKRRALPCGHDVTFADFLMYVLNSYEKDFAPYVSMCDPCKLQPFYVVKAETAHRDNGFILEHLSLAWSVKGENFEDAAITRMVNSTIWASYKRFQDAQRKGCDISLKTLNLRLWKTFMMEGIVLEGSTPPPLEDVDQSKLLAIVIGAYRDAMGQGADMTPQKRKYMVAAYKNLSPRVLDSIRERYSLDFQLFSYDSHPHDIYGGV